MCVCVCVCLCVRGACDLVSGTARLNTTFKHNPLYGSCTPTPCLHLTTDQLAFCNANVARVAAFSRGTAASFVASSPLWRGMRLRGGTEGLQQTPQGVVMASALTSLCFVCLSVCFLGASAPPSLFYLFPVCCSAVGALCDCQAMDSLQSSKPVQHLTCTSMCLHTAPKTQH